ncbi:hypothetical protein HZS_76 [Henneguya salminicola]|nr:hypothetical protein HZS_76 [Henneguya salminicola]
MNHVVLVYNTIEEFSFMLRCRNPRFVFFFFLPLNLYVMGSPPVYFRTIDKEIFANSRTNSTFPKTNSTSSNTNSTM